MFGYCVWYTIDRSHRLNVLIHRLAIRFRTDFFPGHITLHSHMTKQNASHHYALQCKITKPWFHSHGSTYQTKTTSSTKDVFYAIQQNYLMYNEQRLGIYHVSLAYRVNVPFTEEDILYAASLIPVDNIWAEDMYLSLNDCGTILPKHWIQLKRNI